MLNDDMTVPSWDIEGGRVVRVTSMLKCLKITDGNGNTVLAAGVENSHVTENLIKASQKNNSLSVEECYVPVSPGFLVERIIH